MSGVKGLCGKSFGKAGIMVRLYFTEFFLEAYVGNYFVERICPILRHKHDGHFSMFLVCTCNTQF